MNIRGTARVQRNLKGQIMKVSRVLSFMHAGVISLAMISGTTSYAQSSQTADVSFKVRVKVGGNVSAIDTGTKVLCRLTYRKAEGERHYGRSEMLFLPAGTIVDTPDGVIERTIVLKDQTLGANFNPNDGEIWSGDA